MSWHLHSTTRWEVFGHNHRNSALRLYIAKIAAPTLKLNSHIDLLADDANHPVASRSTLKAEDVQVYDLWCTRVALEVTRVDQMKHMDMRIALADLPSPLIASALGVTRSNTVSPGFMHHDVLAH